MRTVYPADAASKAVPIAMDTHIINTTESTYIKITRIIFPAFDFDFDAVGAKSVDDTGPVGVGVPIGVGTGVPAIGVPVTDLPEGFDAGVPVIGTLVGYGVPATGIPAGF